MDKQYNIILESLWLKLWAIGLFLIAAGCSELPGSGEDSDLLPIEEGILFTVKETHDQSHKVNDPVVPFIQLNLKTRDIYRCMNFRMESDLLQIDTGLIIGIKGVRDSNFCLTALGPGTMEYPLDIDLGEYNLTFSYKGESYTYHLTVTDSSLQVNGSGPSFVAPDINTFWRYPENSFAYLCRSTAETRWMCEDFEQMLNDSLEVSSFSFPDHGTKPYPSDEDQYDIASYYHYPEETVFLEAGQMLEAYADSVVSQQEGAYLSVISWKNQGFRSWTDVGE